MTHMVFNVQSVEYPLNFGYIPIYGVFYIYQRMLTLGSLQFCDTRLNKVGAVIDELYGFWLNTNHKELMFLKRIWTKSKKKLFKSTFLNLRFLSRDMMKTSGITMKVVIPLLSSLNHIHQ